MAIPVQIASQIVITTNNPTGIPSCDVIVVK